MMISRYAMMISRYTMMISRYTMMISRYTILFVKVVYTYIAHSDLHIYLISIESIGNSNFTGVAF